MKEKIDVVAERLHGASGVEYGRAARAIEHYEKAGHGSFSTTMKYYTRVPADLQKLAAEALRELLFGAQNAPTGGPTPITLPSNPEELAALKAELQEKLLQIHDFEGRARQDSNLRPSDS